MIRAIKLLFFVALAMALPATAFGQSGSRGSGSRSSGSYGGGSGRRAPTPLRSGGDGPVQTQNSIGLQAGGGGGVSGFRPGPISAPMGSGSRSFGSGAYSSSSSSSRSRSRSRNYSPHKTGVTEPVAFLSAESEAREWVDNTGKFRISAKIVEIRPEEILLSHSGDDRMVRVAWRRLSFADKRYVMKLLAEKQSASPAVNS